MDVSSGTGSQAALEAVCADEWTICSAFHKGCFYMEKIKKISEEMVRDGMSHPTMFEIETALSFLYFLDKKVDVVLLETGMGGRLDATNVVKKPIAVIIASEWTICSSLETR